MSKSQEGQADRERAWRESKEFVRDRVQRQGYTRREAERIAADAVTRAAEKERQKEQGR